MISRINLRRGNGRHRWRSAENAPPQFMHKLVPCLVRFPRRDGRQYRGNKHGQSIITQTGLPQLADFRVTAAYRFYATGGQGGGRGILSPKGGKGKKSRSPPPLPTRCRSIEFATLSTPFFLSTRALLVPCNCVEIVFRECVGRETRINTR